MRRIIPLLLVCSLLMVSASVPPAQAASQAPDASVGLAEDPVAGVHAPGNWYPGPMPSNPNPNKPVLVFVHGKGGSASVWWGDTMYHGINDMRTYAYNDGYRTAYVDLYPEGTMWDNGELLANMLNQITAYYGVNKVVIVAHSKGGVDANTASAHFGASSKIAKVITLGTPHWGSPLADLAYSNWASWLAELLGQLTDATYVMQTGYMEGFRVSTDGRDPGVAYRTVSGKKCGPILTALWLGCVYISGEDDGMVPVWSAQKPGAAHLKTGDWDHDEIRMGSRVWSTIFPHLTLSGQAASAEDLQAAPGGNRASAAVPAPGNLILRGGKVSAEERADLLPVESGVKAATFTVLSSDPDVEAALASPDGQLYPVKLSTQVADEEVFAGAWLGSVEVQEPAAGEWKLVTSGPKGSAYLMIAAFEGGVTAVLDKGSHISSPGTARTLSVDLKGAEVAESQVAVTLTGRDGIVADEIGFAAGKATHKAAVPVPQEPGVYTVTLTVTGKLADGSAFERTVVTSFAAYH